MAQSLPRGVVTRRLLTAAVLTTSLTGVAIASTVSAGNRGRQIGKGGARGNAGAGGDIRRNRRNGAAGSARPRRRLVDDPLVRAGGGTAARFLQVRGGSSAGERVVNFHAGPTGSDVTAQVRTAGPADRFWVITYGYSVMGTITLTAAAWGYLVRGTAMTSPGGAAVTLHGVNSEDPTPLWALYNWTKANAVRVNVSECRWMSYYTASSAAYRQQIIDTITASVAYGHTAIVTLMNACQDNRLPRATRCNQRRSRPISTRSASGRTWRRGTRATPR